MRGLVGESGREGGTVEGMWEESPKTGWDWRGTGTTLARGRASKLRVGEGDLEYVSASELCGGETRKGVN